MVVLHCFVKSMKREEPLCEHTASLSSAVDVLGLNEREIGQRRLVSCGAFMSVFLVFRKTMTLYFKP